MRGMYIVPLAHGVFTKSEAAVMAAVGEQASLRHIQQTLKTSLNAALHRVQRLVDKGNLKIVCVE